MPSQKIKYVAIAKKCIIFYHYLFSKNSAHTQPVIEKCEDCERPFRTYVSDTICHLPDGGQVLYKDPQLKCPECDPNGYGWFMNADFCAS